MAFHPERLTGRRRRRWEASLNWAPAMPVADIPKVLVARLKKPHEVRAFARVNVGESPVDPLSKTGRHYVVIIRNRVVVVDHPHAAAFEAIRAIADAEDWSQRCPCYLAREKWVTAACVDAPWDKRGQRRLAWAEREGDMPPAFVPLVFKRRPPVVRHRYGFDRGETRAPDDKAHPAPFDVPPRTERVAAVTVERLSCELERRIDAWLLEHRLKFGPTAVVHECGAEDDVGEARAVGAARNRTGGQRVVELVRKRPNGVPSLQLEVNVVLWWLRLGRLGVSAPHLFPLEASVTSRRDTLIGVALDATMLGVLAQLPPPKGDATQLYRQLAHVAQCGVVLTGTPGKPYAVAKFAWTDYRRGAGSDVNLDHLTDATEINPANTCVSPTRHPGAAVHPPGALTRLHPWSPKTASSDAG